MKETVVQFTEWLSRKPSWREAGALLLMLYIGNVAWAAALTQAFAYWDITIEYLVDMETRSRLQELAREHPLQWLWIFIRTSLSEEFWYRLLPLSVMLVAHARGSATKKDVLMIAGAFAVLFGSIHGIGYWYNVALQGVFGLTLALVFLKCSGMDYRAIHRGFLAVWSLHVAWNMFAMAFNVANGYL